MEAIIKADFGASKMKKINVSLQLTKPRYDWLKSESERLGVTQREVMNRIIDNKKSRSKNVNS